MGVYGTMFFVHLAAIYNRSEDVHGPVAVIVLSFWFCVDTLKMPAENPSSTMSVL